jgi:hypothetical protein
MMVDDDKTLKMSKQSSSNREWRRYVSEFHKFGCGLCRAIATDERLYRVSDIYQRQAKQTKLSQFFLHYACSGVHLVYQTPAKICSQQAMPSCSIVYTETTRIGSSA